MKFNKRSACSFIAVLVLMLYSCSRTESDIVPDVFVEFTIDLLDPEFVNLTAIGGTDTIDGTTNNWGYRAAGYDGNGIIVYRGPDEYYAYDRTCPYDFAVNGLSVKVKADFSVAVCPECGTSYSLSTYGVPVSGPGKYPLKNYKTSFSNERYVRVWNQ